MISSSYYYFFFLNLKYYFREGPDSVITQEHYSYLLEQLNFFSDLALGRNYLWKTVLEKIFPINFVFSQISEEKLSKGVD